MPGEVMGNSLQVDVITLLVFAPYIAAWWWALRCVVGKRFVPWEWVPLAIASMGVPIILREAIGGASFRDYGGFIVGCWMALPVPIILTYLLSRWLRKREESLSRQP